MTMLLHEKWRTIAQKQLFVLFFRSGMNGESDRLLSVYFRIINPLWWFAESLKSAEMGEFAAKKNEGTSTDAPSF
ncbi:MAG: hypothetical protein IKQ03_07385 [Prevotella sp.]|nr:hypothetical protein [Prevotella sp.]MBR4239211.1 hypothetical protein [Prevotella sp.]